MEKPRLARDKDSRKQVRAIVVPVPSKDWELAALALTHESKNLYNTVTFLVRQISAAYEFDKETSTHTRIEELHANQTEVLDAFNVAIAAVNAKRVGKDKARFLPLLEERMTVSPLSVALDVTVLDNVARMRVDADGDFVYRRIPAVCAQQVVRSAIDAWKAALSAIKRLGCQSRQIHRTRPKFPGFIDKNGHFPIRSAVCNSDQEVFQNRRR